MTASGFPLDEYTPHGYLANPFAVARSWSESEGGCLRTTRDFIGLGWQLPWALRAQASVDLVVTLGDDGPRQPRRSTFGSASLVSPHHSANLFVYRWEELGRIWEAAYTLVERDVLGVQVTWQPSPERPGPAGFTPDPSGLPDTTLSIGLVGWRRHRETGDDGTPLAGTAEIPGPPVGFDADGWVDLGDPYGRCELVVDSRAFAREGVAVGQPLFDAASDETTDPATGRRATVMVVLRVGGAPSGSVHAIAHLRPFSRDRAVGIRGPMGPKVGSPVDSPEGMMRGFGGEGALVASAIARARDADDSFWSGATRLEGDWPPAWRRGWVHDTETTRMCVYPPGGIFTDVWPAWMVQWPRAVVAEGTLDMARFAYASPDLAQRALLSLFRDAEAPNVPCVFQHGEPNMVAADGSVCGTSPAWCVPFYNLERLFKLTLDRAWLEEIYPYLIRYLEWWLAERTDPEGWSVYKCTWEAGEDDTPRLDPERRGDNVVSAFVRPVELQAMMALSAGVLRRFAAVLGRTDDLTRWRRVESEYLARTRQLWDPAERRFRDWDARNGRFLAPAGEPNYWGIDPCRYSALAFTPLLAGLADDEIRSGLRAELQQYDSPPWTLWASWSYVVLEAAPNTGDLTFAGRVAAEIVSRVYDELDARKIDAPSHPTPGVAREYWPLDLDAWASCEGYGWGANTASLLVRQIFGFFEGPYLDESETRLSFSDDEDELPAGWRSRCLSFELRPALPSHLMIAGNEYWLTNLPCRGSRLSLGYRVADESQDGPAAPSALTILLSADVPTHCQVVNATIRQEHRSNGPRSRHEVGGQNGGVYVVELRSGS
jgi:hypothetical protein